MFRIFTIIGILLLPFFCGATQLNILTIGNSFTWSLKTYFAKVAESVGDSVNVEYANFGGCTLDRHWGYVCEEECGAETRKYGGGKMKLRDILKSRKWDIVTIQQGSHKSWDYTTYMPYAKNLVEYIGRYSPESKIMIQQTWSYRADCPRLKKWGFDSAEMFGRVSAAYGKLAEELKLETIPTGQAVQWARCVVGAKFKPTSRPLKEWSYPDLPEQSGELVGKFSWHKRCGKMEIVSDTIHLNDYGEYLQALVWYARLFDKPAAAVKFNPETMDDSLAEELKKIADKAVADSKERDALRLNGASKNN